jgi:hypothetical protein
MNLPAEENRIQFSNEERTNKQLVATIFNEARILKKFFTYVGRTLWQVSSVT